MIWWQIALLCLGGATVLFLLSALFYRQFFKRLYDIVFSGLAIIALSPVFLILIALGAIFMKGNPFFVQLRPGKDEKIFKMIKFRTMTNQKDADGNLLSDEKRLNKYGKFLRKTSLDEIPELFNVFIGQMSIIGPRPLLVEYLPLYSDFQKRRHEIMPGLTGQAQVNGRNAIAWEDKFIKDIEYIDNVSFWLDIKIILCTIKKILKRENISQEGQATASVFKGTNNEDLNE